MKPAIIIASSRLHSVRLLILLICVSLAQPFAALAQTNAPALPPAAQEAFDKGIMAAREQGYLVAIRYLQEARKLAPQAPQIFRSLGAVEAKIPGRELRSIAWYGAYLAALPQAPDAADVKNEIVRLNIRNQIALSGLIKSVQDAASQLSDYDPQLTVVSRLWADAGDIGGAQKTTDLIQHSLMKSRALIYIAHAKTKVGDLAGAKNTLASALMSADRIDTEPHIGIATPKGAKNETLAYIAMAQAQSGDIAGAQKTFDLIDDANLKTYYKPEFAKAQAKVQPSIQSVITVSDWLKKLDDDNNSNDCPLNTEPFLDLAGYLKALPSGDAWKIVDGMLRAAEKIVSAQNVITDLLKQQVGK
jgi:hypothetical protein